VSSCHQAVIAWGVIYNLWVHLCFCYLRKKMSFPRVIRGPLWLSPIVAPEPLRWYPSGTRRGSRLLMGRSSLLIAVLFCEGGLAHPRV
jgi:hypothetical protein